MAGPVATYLATQMAAQTAFNVPFGLLALVNTSITAATAAGEFNVTVDCSLFTAEDVSNLRIYLDSLGYLVEYAKGDSTKGLLIDWGRFRDVPGTAVTVFQGTSPWIVAGTVAATQSGPWTVSLTSGSVTIGTVDQGAPGVSPWLVVIPPSLTAVTTSVTVTTSPTTLLAANPARKGLVVQNTTDAVFVKFDTTSSTVLYSYELPRKGVLEKDNYSGPVTAVTASGSVTVLVTELV